MLNNLPSSLNAEACRKRLEGLSPIAEKREGRLRNVYLIFFGGLIGMSFTIMAVVVAQWSVYLAVLPLIWVPLMAYFMSYEQALIVQNDAKHFFKFVEPALKPKEKVLLVLNGRAASLSLPEWLESDFYDYCYFVFTTDRLMVITLSKSKVGFHKISDFWRNNTFSNVVNKVFVCDYVEPENCQFGGLSLNLMSNLTHTKIKLRPLGEGDFYEWSMPNKGTKNGQLLNEVIFRLK